MPPKKPPAKGPAAALKAYGEKRNFGDTPEPRAHKAVGEGASFVVQEHHARSHHFDLRLEMGGVLVSWAVPKGIPEDEAAKRLAVHVEDHPLEYGTFDLLHLDGRNLRNLPLTERFDELTKLIGEESERVRLSKVWKASEGADLFQQACKNGLEGIISKKAGGRYLDGNRRDWFKSKCRAQQEFVICGYTAPKGSLKGFGALLLASFENGRFVPRGKVGTGFSDRERLRLVERFKPLVTKKPTLPEAETGVTWLKPELVAEVEFAEITREGSIRQGSYIALREDKAATEVHLDTIATNPTKGVKMKVAGITITHPDRVVYPADGVTKLEVARYYERVAEFMLPFLANRPIALVRAPSGIGGEMFFQKSFPKHLPDQVTQKKLAAGTTIFYLRNARGLVSLAQFGAIEFHPWGSRMPRPEKPDQLIWDLDPDDGVAWKEVLGAAFFIRDFLAERNLHALVKTSGGKGLHLHRCLEPARPRRCRRLHAGELVRSPQHHRRRFHPSRATHTAQRMARSQATAYS